jgi:hypothetical protein
VKIKSPAEQAGRYLRGAPAGENTGSLLWLSGGEQRGVARHANAMSEEPACPARLQLDQKIAENRLESGEPTDPDLIIYAPAG